MNNHCYSDSAALTTVEQLLSTLKNSVKAQTSSETINFEDAMGRVLAADIVSGVNLPPFANAAVDGFAFKHSDLKDFPTSLPISATITAGQAPMTLPAHTAARIMTGAALPRNVDTVVMQEDVHIHAEQVCIESPVKAGINCRPAGEDVAVGQQVLASGATLSFSAIGILAAMGVESVDVFRPLNVALFSSGDEIVSKDQPLASGHRYDANRPMLKALLQKPSYRVEDHGVLPDDLQATQAALDTAAQSADVIITSGGASTGDADFLINALRETGDIDVWRLALKPGRPFAFGRIADTPVLCLPGNPVAVGVCALRFVMPFLAALAGGPWRDPVQYSVAAGFTMAKKLGRTEYVRASLAQTSQGLVVNKHAKQGSGVLMSLVESDGLVVLPSERAAVAIGDMVFFMPFSQF